MLKRTLIGISLGVIFFIIGIFIFQDNETVVINNLNEKKVHYTSKDYLDSKVTTATIAAVGDILIHNSVYEDAKTVEGTYNFNPMFELVKPYLSRADVTIANQETMIGGTSIGLSSYPRFNSPYEVADALKYVGVDVVTLANNHTLDRGEIAIQNAISHWKTLGIQYSGSYVNEEDANQIRFLNTNGITFSFLSYTYGTNGIPIPAGKPYLVNLIEEKKILEDIAIAKNISDVVVVSLHFGNEYQRMPNKTQKSLATLIANAGADIIIGHHPHVLQPVQWIEREDGKKSFVAYSLGNFISAQKGIYRLIGGIVQLEVEKKTIGRNVEITLRKPAFIPTYTHRPNFRNYKIIPLVDVTQQQLRNKDSLLQEINAHMSQWIPELDFKNVLKTNNNE